MLKPIAEKPTMTCKVCEHASTLAFKKRVLGKYNVSYFQCGHCGFLQTEQPYWLDEAYQNAITSLDLGLVQRNEVLARFVAAAIRGLFHKRASFVDFGGGYGLFVRMMRDRGFDFYRHDIYCDNIFAKGFDVTDQHKHGRFEALTAFEVFEHLPEPLHGLKEMCAYADNILFTTELQPSGNTIEQGWWYLAPETGQHVSFYTPSSLRILGERCGLHLYTAGNYHLFSRKPRKNGWFAVLSKQPAQRLMNALQPLPSLLANDFNQARKELNRKLTLEEQTRRD